jgi:hypothetical protein
MGRVWNVISNSGQHAVFDCGAQTMEVPEPENKLAREVFIGLQPGTTVDDGTLALMLRPKRLPKA